MEKCEKLEKQGFGEQRGWGLMLYLSVSPSMQGVEGSLYKRGAKRGGWPGGKMGMKAKLEEKERY